MNLFPILWHRWRILDHRNLVSCAHLLWPVFQSYDGMWTKLSVELQMKVLGNSTIYPATKFISHCHMISFPALLTKLQISNESDSDSASQSTNSSSAEQDRPRDSSPLRQRRGSASRQQDPGAASSNGDIPKDYTPEQLAAVNKLVYIIHIVSWEPEGHNCSSKMFRWEPAGHCCSSKMLHWEPEGHYRCWIAKTLFWLSTDDIFTAV